MIPYSRQHIDDSDVAAVADVLRSDWLTTGPSVAAFEASITEYTGASHAVAFSNGTAALHACMDATGMGPGSTIATSPLSFAASANCARYVGAQVEFVDIDPTTLNLDPTAVPACDALVAVHYSGLPVALDHLSERPAIIVEDAAQALGAHTADGPVGNCARSDMTVFSFHPVKTITTGEGGAVTTNDADLAGRLRSFRSHGMEPGSDAAPWEYDITRLGFNYRLTDFQAALGRSQMTKIHEFVERRNDLAARYDDALRDLDVVLPPSSPAGVRHARHLYPVRLRGRDAVYRSMRASGLGVQVHHVPIYRLSIYGLDPTRWPNTESAYAQLLSLPLHPGLTDEEQLLVIDELRRLVG